MSVQRMQVRDTAFQSLSPSNGMPKGFGRLDFSEWLYGLVSAFIGGGAAAVVSGVVVSVNDPDRYNLQTAHFYELVASVFAISGLLNMMSFLRQKPLPPMTTTEDTIQRTSVAGQPDKVTVASTVTKTVVDEEQK